jgi:ADP-ribose pyrophosphatase YjhB (NUDIX family)
LLARNGVLLNQPRVFRYYQSSSDTGPALFRFCPFCASQLELRELDARMRPVCPACGFTHYHNPLPVIALLIVDQGRVLLGRRRYEPGQDLWATPSGYIEFDEDFITTGVREAQEETGLLVEILSILDVHASFLSPKYHFLTVYLLASVRAGLLQPGAEWFALGWFPLSSPLPPLAFVEDAVIIERFLRAELPGIPLSQGQDNDHH